MIMIMIMIIIIIIMLIRSMITNIRIILVTFVVV